MTVRGRSKPLCSIRECPREATHRESAELRNWKVVVYYCLEHTRELEQGIPMGGLAIDGARVDFLPHDETLPPENGHGLTAVGPQ